MGDNSNQNCDVLYFQVQDIFACLNLKNIDKVIHLVWAERLPNVPSYVLGVINISGQAILVVDLTMRMGFSRVKKYSLETPIIICSDGSERVGLVVDQIYGLRSISDDMKQFDETHNADVVYQSLVSINNQLALLLDIKKIIKNIVPVSNDKMKKISRSEA